MEVSGTLLVDLDGVLTDGKQYIDHTGEKMFKAFHSRDVRAIREFVSMGWEVVIVSADDWDGGFHFAEKVGAIFEVVRDKSTLPLKYSNYVAIGDDAWDVPMLKAAVIGFVPIDADESVRTLAGVGVCSTLGGQGVVAEVLRRIVNLMQRKS